MSPTVYSADNASTLYSRPSTGAPSHEKFIYPYDSNNNKKNKQKTPNRWCAKRHVQRISAAMLSGGIYPLYRRIRRCQQAKYPQPVDGTHQHKPF